MSDYPVHLDSEFDYGETSFRGNTVVSEERRAHLSPLPIRLKTDSWDYQYAKRLVDLIGALLMLSLCMIPGLIIAGLVAATTRGPIFYREWRIGRRGRPFRIWKFRSMRVNGKMRDSESSSTSNLSMLGWRVHKTGVDPRVTPIGRFLRQWSLDELPQIFNVLRGEMSLVGPRPVVQEEIPLYGQYRYFYFAAVPGLSGLWQVSGRSNVTFASRVNIDAFYVQNWSLWSDIMILCKTIPAVINRTGAR